MHNGALGFPARGMFLIRGLCTRYTNWGKLKIYGTSLQKAEIDGRHQAALLLTNVELLGGSK